MMRVFDLLYVASKNLFEQITAIYGPHTNNAVRPYLKASMAKNIKRDRPSQQTVAEATRIARATQRPGQSKEQTRLIAQGIQKGIDQYKKQQKAKAREMDRRRKKTAAPEASEETPVEMPERASASTPGGRLPWILLGISWVGFALYLLYIAR